MELVSKPCPYCAEEINVKAIKCKHCGEFLDGSGQGNNSHNININQKERKWSPGIAALLSLFLPGAGQIYKGKVILGLFWMFFVTIGYFMLIIPGLILHLLCIILAATGDPYK